MENSKLALYKGNHKADLVKRDSQTAIVKINHSNNQTDIVKSDKDVEVNILATLTPGQLAQCKRIYNNSLLYFGDYARSNSDITVSSEDKRRIAAAIQAEPKPIKHLKEDGVLQAKFGNESNSKNTKSRSKKKSAKEEQQIATDTLILELKTQKQVIEDYLSKKRLGEPEREIIKDILDEEATEYSTYDDIELILKNYLVYLKQKIESLDKISRDNDHRKHIHKKQAYKRDRNRKDEVIQAIFSAWSGKAPTLEGIAQGIVERDNDTKAKELLALNQHQGNIAGLIEAFVISRREMAIDEHHDKVQMMLVPIDVDIEEFVALQNPDLVPYLHPAYEESNNRYALTAFSPVNNMAVDIGEDENGTLSTDGFNGYRSTNPNNNLLLEQAQSNIVEAKLLSAASDVKLLPAAEDNDDRDNSLAIVLVDSNDTSALDLVPTSVSILDTLETDEEVLSLTLTNPASVLDAIIVESNLEERNNNGHITKSTGEQVFHSSCKNLASEVIRNIEKIEPLFYGQLVEGDGSYYNYVNNVTRVFINETGETVTYKGLVKLGKFATDEEIAVDEAKVLEATIKNAANIVEVTQHDGPSLQLLKNDHHLTVPIAKEIVRTYWNQAQNNRMRASNNVLSDEEYETYRNSRSYDPQSNTIRESDLLSISESSAKSLKDFFEYVDDSENAKSVAIRELEMLLSAINVEQAQIFDTPSEEILDLISKMTLELNGVEDIVNQILQKHFQCDLDKAQEMLALYPAVETILEIGTEEDEEGYGNFNLPPDIWTNRDYHYEEWNGQRELLPFPSKQEYKEFVGFIKNIKGSDENLIRDSILLMVNLERTLELLNSDDLEVAKELETKFDNEAEAKAQREVEEKSEEAVIEDISNSTQELLNIDIQINKDIKNNSEAELKDLGFVDPTINISVKDLPILEDILQNKLSDKRLPLRHQMVWRKFFESVLYEEVNAETINEKLTKARKLLHRS